jgi:hypothetical protein
MSADNGIYIHKFRNGWAVEHCQAIDNIYWHRGKKKYNYGILYSYFRGAKRFKTKGRALKYAFKLQDEILLDDFCPILEYGICEV